VTSAERVWTVRATCGHWPASEVQNQCQTNTDSWHVPWSKSLWHSTVWV